MKDRRRILIVDDSSLVREQLREVVESLGYVVVGPAADGVAALELYDREAPDVVILDVIMPRMHGIECFRELRRRDVACRILMHTCLAQELAQVKDLRPQLEAGLVLAKPSQPEQIRAGLELALGLTPPSGEMMEPTLGPEPRVKEAS